MPTTTAAPSKPLTRDQRREAFAALQSKEFTRDFNVTREAVDAEARTVEVAFSSEQPYDRWWGTEILDHSPKSVRLGRLNGSAAVLVNHDPDQHVGVVESARIDKDRKGRALLRFGKSPEADKILQDIVDGIRSLVSVGYRIHTAVLEKTGDEEVDTYRVTDWEPYEISIVSVPADESVGVGRSVSPETNPTQQEHKHMPEAITQPTQPAAPAAPAITAADRDAELKRLRDAEQTRVREINAIATKFKDKVQGMDDLQRSAINSDMSTDAFRQAVLDKLEESGVLRVAEHPAIGMSDKEKARFSFCRALAFAAEPHSPEMRKLAGFEIECSQAAQQRTGNARGEGITVPFDMLAQPLSVGSDVASRVAAMLQARAARGFIGGEQRDLVVGTTTAGGHTVATDLLAGSFIELLTNALVVAQVGATMLTDLNGNIAIPRQTSGSTGYWVAENNAPTESQQAFDQVAMTPKTVGAFTDYARRLLLQSSIAVEMFVRMDLARTIALAIDTASINGTGSSNQPTGIRATSGIGSVVGGTDGAAPTWDHMVNLEAAVANANAGVDRMAYLTNTKVRGKLKRTQQFSSSNGMSVWKAVIEENAPVYVSNQVPSNLTKGAASGVCSSIIYGNWAELLIAMWGALDLMLDPYTGATAGTKRLVALQDVDIAVRHPVSFATMDDALTT